MASGAIDADGATDRLDWSSISNRASLPWTFSCWINLGTASGAQYVFCAHDPGDSSVAFIIGTTTTDRVSTTYVHSGTNQQRISSDNAFPTGIHHLVVTHDGTLNSSGVVVYVDGVDVSAGGTTGTGTPSASTGTWSLFGRTLDDARNLDASMQTVGVWDRVLGAGEIAALALKASPLFFPKGLLWEPELWGTAASLAELDPITGTAATADGCAAVERFSPTWYPGSSEEWHAAAGAAAVSVALLRRRGRA